MATAERDYYELLGLERIATEADIKTAFRRLARELHPDVSDAPDEHRFREVAEAYEVLSNAETRALYDRFGTRGLQRAGTVGTTDRFAAFEDLLRWLERAAPRRGGDVGTTVEIELGEAAAGVTRRVELDVTLACEACSGAGREPGWHLVTCTTCHGDGRVRRVTRTEFAEIEIAEQCPRCDGNGRTAGDACAGCEGSGRTAGRREVEVEIPPGVRDGQELRVEGAGHAGQNGAPAGDAVVEVRIRRHPGLERRGDDLHATARLTMTQAARGAIVRVPALDGEIDVALEHGTQPNAVVVLRGKGMPILPGFQRGDLVVHVEVAIPRKLNREQREILDLFERAMGDEVY